jgi:Na+/H+-dicarboxylate symporter
VKLQGRILVGLAAGIAVGVVSKLPAAAPLQRAVLAIEPLGTAFIKLLTMTVVPLVIASLFVGVASLGDVRRLGRIGGKTLAYFLSTTIIAAIIGTTIALVSGVGGDIDPSVRDALTSRFEEQGAGVLRAAESYPTLIQTLLAMVPQNPFAAAAQGDLLPLIIAVCIFAAAATVIDVERRRPVVSFFEGVNDLAMVVIRWLIQLAPPAVFVLIAATVARAGADLLASLALYSLVVVVALAAHVGTTLTLVLTVGARIGVVSFFRSVSDAILLAFSTASSSVTLPVSMAAARNRLGIANEVVSFVLPSGATLNKNGAAVYKAVTAVFLARLYGVELGPAQIVAIVVTSTVAASAGAGVPGSSLVTTLIVLNAIGLGPRAAAGIALVAGVDRPLDMCRTAVNTIGNLVGTAWVGRTESLGVTAPRVPVNDEVVAGAKT